MAVAPKTRFKVASFLQHSVGGGKGQWALVAGALLR